MEQQVAQINLSLERLCRSSAKRLLFGVSDLILPQPSEEPLSSTSAASLKAVKADELSDSSKMLKEEIEELRKLMEEKMQPLEPSRKIIRDCPIPSQMVQN